MPKLQRDDGVEIQWEERGSGPLVVSSVHSFAYPEVIEDLLAEIARDHRVVSYDARGTGGSSRQGPYDVATDRADLQALIERLGERAVALCWGDSVHRATTLAAERPELVPAVVFMGGGGGVVKPEEAAGADALGGSESVMSAFTEMIRNDYRGAMRYLVSTTSPQLSEDEVRERVEKGVGYSSQEAAVARIDSYWNPTEETLTAAKRLGGRFWVIQFPTVWWPRETIEMVRDRLPDAHVIGLGDHDGPLSQPAITAGLVRAATARA